MIPRKPRMAGQQGYVLAGAVIVIFAMTLIGISYFAVTGYETRQAQLDLASQRAFWLAEAGKERALRWMTIQVRPPDTDLTIFTDQAGPSGGRYSVACVVDTATLYSATKGFVLDCTGASGARERRIRQRIRMVSFAQYAYFTDEEKSPGGNTIWFVSADVIQGMIHTNGVFHLQGAPTFLGPVTTSADHMVGYQYYDVYDAAGWPVGGNAPNFAEGFTLNVPDIPLPTQTLDLKAEAQSGGLYLANPTTIEMGVDVNGNPMVGWLRYRTTPPPNTNPWTSVAISTFSSGVVYSDNDVHVSGIVAGELTIGCGNNIYIVDNIRYRDSDAQGTPFANCRDLLGLLAQKNIIYKDNAANNADLIIDAVMMALDTSITAENYSTRPVSGKLTIWGGLIQKYRGPVGTTSNLVITHGFRKDYHYDDRVTGRTPPAFPLTGVYEKVAWWESWDDAYPF